MLILVNILNELSKQGRRQVLRHDHTAKPGTVACIDNKVRKLHSQLLDFVLRQMDSRSVNPGADLWRQRVLREKCVLTQQEISKTPKFTARVAHLLRMEIETLA